MRAANRAAIDAAAAAGVPLLNFANMTAAHGDACNASLDGVHMRQYTDHLRAAILLSYLCGEDGRFQPWAASEPWPTFNASAAACARVPT